MGAKKNEKAEDMIRTLKDLEQIAIDDIDAEEAELATEMIKERIRELRAGERTLGKLKKHYKELLNKSLDDVL